MKGKELIVIKKKESKIKFICELIKELFTSAVMLFLVACGCAMIYAVFLVWRGCF